MNKLRVYMMVMNDTVTKVTLQRYKGFRLSLAGRPIELWEDIQELTPEAAASASWSELAALVAEKGQTIDDL